jgi:hypothetical protein
MTATGIAFEILSSVKSSKIGFFQKKELTKPLNWTGCLEKAVMIPRNRVKLLIALAIASERQRDELIANKKIASGIDLVRRGIRPVVRIQKKLVRLPVISLSKVGAAIIANKVRPSSI